jgi:FkbM family methyltransferase
MIKKKLYRLKNFLKGNEWYHKYDVKINKAATGNSGYEWVICPDLINSQSIVYSFGAGTEISFDTELVRLFGVKIFLFDPTPKSIQYVKDQKLGSNFNFEEIGIATFTGNANFFLPINPDYVSATLDKLSDSQSSGKVKVERLSEIMKRHQHEFIDLLKMDVEGAEYDVIDDILQSKINIHQLLIEFHHRFAHNGIKKTRKTVANLRKAGFALFNVSDTGEEYSFVNVMFKQ